MALQVIVPPTVEPISLSDAKLHTRVDDDTSDDLFNVFITTARIAGENLTRRAFVTQTLQLTLDRFPTGYWPGSIIGNMPGYPRIYPNSTRRLYRRQSIELPKPPLQSIISVSYVDPNGDTQTLPESAYILVNDSDTVNPFIVPACGTSWPETQDIPNCVTIQYESGWPLDSNGNPTTPKAICAWMFVRVTGLYSQRENFVVGTVRKNLIQMDRSFVDNLLDPFVIMEIV
jgi:hypothetical protein